MYEKELNFLSDFRCLSPVDQELLAELIAKRSSGEITEKEFAEKIKKARK